MAVSRLFRAQQVKQIGYMPGGSCSKQTLRKLAIHRHRAFQATTKMYVCTNTCQHTTGKCDDGGAGSQYDDCDYGSDCADCGPRSEIQAALSTVIGYNTVTYEITHTQTYFYPYVCTEESGGSSTVWCDNNELQYMWYDSSDCTGSPVNSEDLCQYYLSEGYVSECPFVISENPPVGSGHVEVHLPGNLEQYTRIDCIDLNSDCRRYIGHCSFVDTSIIDCDVFWDYGEYNAPEYRKCVNDGNGVCYGVADTSFTKCRDP